jgi:hypothetical protein
MTKDEIRARLLAEASKVIDEILATKPDAQVIKLDEIERLALQGRAEFGTSLVQALSEEARDAEDATAPTCERCGSRMHHRGHPGRQVTTEAGAMKLERAYCVCPECGANLFPLG